MKKSRKPSSAKPEKPDCIFRYHNARLINLSLAGSASTITFKGKSHRDIRRTDHWCFFKENDFGKTLKEAIDSDLTLNLLIYRFVFSDDGETTKVEDWLMQVWRVNKE